MPPRTRYYDPLVETGEPVVDQLPPIAAVVAAAPGTYLLADDVVACLQGMANAYTGDAREALRDAADVFAAGVASVASDGLTDAPTAICAATLPDENGPIRCELDAGHDGEHRRHEGQGWFVWDDEPVSGGGEDDPTGAGDVPAPAETGPDPHPEVALIEVFPSPEGNYWYGRAVDANGNLLGLPQAEAINRDQCEYLAASYWPGKPLYEIPDAMGDALWDADRASEQRVTSSHSGRRVPSPRRLHANRPI